MKKRTVRIKILVIWGFIAGLLNVIVGTENTTFLVIGLICIFLSFGLFMLWNWVRIIAIIFSSIFISIYILLIIAAINRAFQGFAGVACFLHAPFLLLNIFCINVLLHKENKMLFEKGTPEGKKIML